MIGQRTSADELLEIPEGWPRVQLVDGEIVVHDPTLRRQRVLGWLYTELVLWTRSARGRGEAGLGVDHRIDDRNVDIPDLWWVPRSPARDVHHLSDVVGLAVEVTSPGTWRRDLTLKRDRHGEAELDERWIVDLRADAVLVHRQLGGIAPGFGEATVLGPGDHLTSPLLPGFAVAVTEVLDR